MKPTIFSLLFVFMSLFFNAAAQPVLTEPPNNSRSFAELKRTFGHRKKLPKGMEQQALVALSFYPELAGVPVKFVFKTKKLPYSSKPVWWSLLNPFGRRHYKIIISKKSNSIREPVLLKNLAYPAQVGALGHELAHTAWFHRTKTRKIIGAGLRYSNLEFKSRFEKMTDEIALEHGLGFYLLDWCEAVHPSRLNDGDRAKIYYSPDELRLKIRQ